jgi:2'-hydroxyisoflavone reductase
VNILILGGTRFLGRHLVDVAQARGHRLTLFNRGRSAPALFASVEQLRGDREGDLAPLRGRSWDAVVDTCGYLPRIVRQSARALQDRVDQYLFVSSISVYAGTPVARRDESAPRERLPAPDCEDIPGHYGALKAACEDEVLATFGERAILLRPGLIVGPFDPSGRFTYWIRRVARGGTVLAPADPEYPVQFIDGRDLAGFALELIEQRRQGAFNATGPAAPLNFGDFLGHCRQALRVEADFVWPDAGFLHDRGVAPWTDLPLYAGEEHRGFNEVDIGRALSAGLRMRPLEETCRDTACWTEGSVLPDGAGLAADREAELLDAWQRRNDAGVLRRGSGRG